MDVWLVPAGLGLELESSHRTGQGDMIEQINWKVSHQRPEEGEEGGVGPGSVLSWQDPIL